MFRTRHSGGVEIERKTRALNHVFAAPKHETNAQLYSNWQIQTFSGFLSYLDDVGRSGLLQ
jgi:hypothetical protein